MTDELYAGANATDIAIIGMAAQLPGALTVEAYWANLLAGTESIRPVDRDTLIARGESRGRIDHPNYVPAAAELDQFDGFDAEFFGLGPKDAAIMDPQHRKLLETCWHALEDAGVDPARFAGPIGVFAGCGQGTYYWKNIHSNRGMVDDVGEFLLRHTGNDKDFLATRVSHILNLTGPSVNVQTACSTSLVAVHMACNALLGGECDVALAGGVTIELPHGRGYLFRENEILSPDGHCHAFDHRAQGTVFGSGAAVVALRRLDDALAAGDAIWAVIRGSAINNDGAAKAGYLAPSVNGQARAVAEALTVAECPPDSIGYIECHGTGTALGDPIEVAALTQAFDMAGGGDRAAPCLLGSVKTNIGHLDTAAGTAGLIKAALAVHHGQVPPSLGFEKPNPAIGFDDTPFRVAGQCQDWPLAHGPRRAGVNSLGVGGTNAHVVVEQPPAPPATDDAAWPCHIIAVSGRTRAALDANAAALADWLDANADADLADVSWTLTQTRHQFDRRRILVADTPAQAAAMLRNPDPRQVFDHRPVDDHPRVVFMLPGGGAQYPGMARDLYATEPVFRDWMDRGLNHLRAAHGVDLMPLWLPDLGADTGTETDAAQALRQPSRQLPLLMIVEYALAKLWESWGVVPDALIGHSMGENTAACLAGVMDFTDCIDLVHLRGTLFDQVAPGGMVSVPLSVDEISGDLGDDLDIAAANGPAMTVVSGPRAALDAFAARMAAREIEVQDIPISIAAHSRMLDDILPRFRDFLAGLTLRPPAIPIISNRTGQVLTDAQATDPDYWTAHLRGMVRFGDGIATLAEDPGRLYLEVGPGRAMSALAQANPRVAADRVVSSLRHPDATVGDDRFFLLALARAWAAGVRIDWDQVWGGARRRRLRLPGYQFQRQRYFIDQAAPSADIATAEMPERIEDMAAWGWRWSWRQHAVAVEFDAAGAPRLDAGGTWLILADRGGAGQALADRLRAAGSAVAMVLAGDRFADLGDGRFTLPPESDDEGFGLLLAALDLAGLRPDHVLHLWTQDAAAAVRPGSSVLVSTLERGFYGLLHLGQAMQAEWPDHPLTLTVVTTGATGAVPGTLTAPDLATVAGPVQVLPREAAQIAVRWVDLDPAAPVSVDQLTQEIAAPPEPGAAEVAAWRGGRRLRRTLASLSLAEPGAPAIAAGDVCLITGGFGGIGQVVAQDLARRGARLVLLGRTAADARGHRGQAQRAAIRALEDAGATVLALTADLTEPASVADAVARARREFGRIDVVIHAAGVVNDGLIATKHDAEAADVLAPKVFGAQALIDALASAPPRLTVLFSSSSTALGAAGQVDYVAANAYLDALAAAQPPALGRVVTVNWGVWADAGMAARAAGRDDSLQDVDAALLSGVTAQGYVAQLSPEHWLIDGHRTAGGQALMPGTGIIELMAEASRAAGHDVPIALRDLSFLRPLLVDGPLRVTVGIDHAGRLSVDDGQGDGPNATARLDAVQAVGTPDAIPVPDPDAWDRRDDAAMPSAQEGQMRFGPEWRVLRALRLDGAQGAALLSLDPAFADDAARMVMHPALLDIATGWAMDLIPGYDRAHLWVPMGYDRITVHAPLGDRVVSHVRLVDSGTDSARFAVTLTDASDGAVLVRVDGFALRRMAQGLPPASARPQPSPAEERLHQATALGIRAAEGPALLDRAIAAAGALGGPVQVFVSPLDLPTLVAQAGLRDDREAGQAFERPTLDGEFVAPAPGIETDLAQLWSDLLGIKDIGATDSFFDLGGHSLIAVRLFAQIRKRFGADFAISTLFEAPTIQALAARIEQTCGPRDAAPRTGAAAPAATAAPARQFVVEMGGRRAEQGGGTPFFMVAGMFGNVMNLRALAQRVGRDRPFYGLQARGLFGGAPPHDDFAAAARDYLAEMRQVHPDGPWLLGGFSGGGLIALEIARMLADAGEQVGQLVLLDTPLPMRPELSRRDRLAIRLAEMREQGPSFAANWLRDKRAYRQSLRDRDRRREGVDADAPAAFHDLAIEAAFRAALPKVALSRWTGPAALFRPPLDHRFRVSDGRWVSAAREYVLDDNGWSDWMPRLDVIEVPGDHDSMVLEPNVRVLASRLARLLAQADEDADPAQAAE